MPNTDSQPSYTAIHGQLNAHRGRARRHDCIDCGHPARQWSYDHADPDELTSPTGLEYSTDLAHYHPRCTTCHRTFDQQHRRQGIPRLHALAVALEPQIRAATIQRNKARRHNDIALVEQWDDQLDELTAPLRTPRTERPR